MASAVFGPLCCAATVSQSDVASGTISTSVLFLAILASHICKSLSALYAGARSSLKAKMTEKLVDVISTTNDSYADGKKTKVVVVLGAQWGDEGKGRIVELLSQGADVVCRCQVCV